MAIGIKTELDMSYIFLSQKLANRDCISPPLSDIERGILLFWCIGIIDLTIISFFCSWFSDKTLHPYVIWILALWNLQIIVRKKNCVWTNTFFPWLHTAFICHTTYHHLHTSSYTGYPNDRGQTLLIKYEFKLYVSSFQIVENYFKSK